VSTTPFFTIARGRERSLQRKHPWVFAGSIAGQHGDVDSGETVRLQSHSGEFLGWAGYSHVSQLAARVWSFDADDVIDAHWFAARIAASAARRNDLCAITNSVRLIHGESDGLPGVTVDRFGPVAVMQLSSAPADYWRAAIVDGLMQLDDVDCVVERSDVDARKKEGLDPVVGVAAGEVPESIDVMERLTAPHSSTVHEWMFAADPLGGHKTGFYLDQRDARAAIAGLSDGRCVANLFSYTGGFTVAAARGGASDVTSVDSSAPALAGLRANAARNGVPTGDIVDADVFKHLRVWRDEERRFDLIICDPPKLAASAKQVDRATRAYKDLNWLSFRLLDPGGLLVTFSCSGSLSEDLFTKVVAGAALDAGRDVEIIGRLGQPSDHPISLSFPEGAYLKGLICRVR
jgi:23S rRNA (cytosine1962-C5)-methyltransferase